MLVHPALPASGSGNSSAPLNLDSSGNLLVNVAQGSFAVSTGAQYNSTPPTLTSGSTGPLQADVNGRLLIAGTISASSSATYNSSAPTFSNGTSNALQADVNGRLLTNTGAALATPLRIDPVGTTTQPVSIAGSVPVTGTFYQATQPVSAASLPLPAGAATAAKQPALGTAGSASADVLTVQGIASMTALKVDGSAVTQPVSGTFYQATQPVSASALPLPTGAATAAKQPALGTAGTSSADVLTVQGIASMTALKVDGSAVTQPVSGTFWQTTQPVSIAATLSTNAAQSGTWTVQPGNTQNTTAWLTSQTPATSGGLSALTSAATALTVVKGSAGQLYGYDLYNAGASAVYLQIFNAATTGAVTLGTTSPVLQIVIPPTSGRNVSYDSGIAFSSGLVFAVTTARTGSTAPSTAADLNFFYK